MNVEIISYGMRNAVKKLKMYSKFYCKIWRNEATWEDSGIDGSKTLKTDLKQDMTMWNRYIWLRIGSSGGVF
jgi:hypothetical protein